MIKQVPVTWWMLLPFTLATWAALLNVVFEIGQYESSYGTAPGASAGWLVLTVIMMSITSVINLFMGANEYRDDPLRIPIPWPPDKKARLERRLKRVGAIRSEVSTRLARMRDKGEQGPLVDNLNHRKEALDMQENVLKTELGFLAYKDLDRRAGRVIEQELRAGEKRGAPARALPRPEGRES